METLSEAFFDYNSKGLIPGPDESERDYLARVQYCLGLKENPPDFIKAADNLNDLDIKESRDKVRKIYDIDPDWVPLFRSNQGLAPWQVGCAWIYQLEKDSPLGAALQIRKANSFFSYSSSEIISHEYVHIARMAFEEPKYEEFLAYQTSSSSFRAFWGALIHKQWEAWLFFFTVMILLLLDFSLLYFQLFSLFTTFMWLKMVPIVMIIFSCLRLLRRRKKFKKCLARLSSLTAQPMHVVIRLTDQEIDQFSTMNTEKIQQYINSQEPTSLRWKVTKKAYIP